MKQAKFLSFGIVLLFAGFTLAFAQGGGGRSGGGYGRHPMEGYGSGPGMMYAGPGFGDCMMDDDDIGSGPGYGPGRGMMPGQRGPYGADLTPEQRQQLDTARQKFFAETQAVRDQIREKRIALQKEWNSPDPDQAKVDQLQQESSDLQRQFDQQRIQHQLEVSDIFGANMGKEQLTQVTAQRQKFFSETQDLRDAIREKRFELQQEIHKQNPDGEKALQLQRELSDLEGQFDQKRIQQQLEIRKLLPENAGRMGSEGGK